MDDAAGPSRNADRPSRNDDAAPEESRYYCAQVLTSLRTWLPYLERVINDSQPLGVVPNHSEKLQYLHSLAATKSLLPARAENCKKVFCELYNTYSHQLNYVSALLPSLDLMNLGASRSSADFSVPHDPRVKSKSLLSTENNVSTFNTLPSLILNGQNTIQTSFAPNTSSSYPKSLETKAQNDDGQFRNSDIMHGKMSRTKPLIKYHDPMLHEIHINDAFRRDSRTLESVKTTPYLNHKKYRKAKYRQQNKGFAINKNQINQDQDKYHSLVSKKMEKNNIIGCPYNSFGPVNETATIKFNKIPKLKTFEDNINSTAVLKTDEKSFKFPPEINLETIVNIPNKVIKDQRSSKSEQNSVLIDYIYQNKSKKQKKCSKEKEFEKIIKDADCSNNDIWVPSRRTRSSVKQKEILENVNVNNSKPKFEIDIITKNDKKIEYSECIKNYDCVSIPVAEDVCGRNEIRHNIISSPSKEQSGVVNPTIARCISQQKNMVSTNEINFTADDHRKVVNKYWLDLLKNQKCKDAINIFQDKDKIKKQKEKQKRKKTKKKVSAESSKNSNEERKNKFLNCISDDNNFNQAENRVEIKKKKSHLNKLNKGSTSFGNIYGHLSTGQHKLKSNESYGNFEILKDRCIFEKKQLKIVIAKLDGNIEGSENCNADTSTNNNIQTNNKPLNIKRAQEIKYKKPFVGPLSVKLARQKMEMELSDSKYERDIKNQLKFETRKVRKKSKAVNRLDKKEKLNSETYIVNKPKLRKARRSELDKHRANITGTFHCEPVLNASTKRLRRTDKKIDYVKTNTSTNNYSQTNNEPLNVQIPQEIKYKKPFVGPLSVKLARQKKEMELSDSQCKRDIKNQLDFETRKVRKKSKSVNRFDKKEEFISETSTSLMIEQPIVLIRPFENNKLLDKITDSNKPFERNSNKSTYIVNKPKLRKTKSELDKLRANITGMFYHENIINAPTKRQCRTDKKIDYVKTNTSTNNYSQTNNEPLNVQIPQEIKYKKPFVGPLSVKLARQKMEMELSDSQYKRDIKNQLDIETRKVRKKSKSVDRFDKKEELISETSTSLMIEQPIVLIRPFENNKLLDKITDSNKPFKQNSKTSTYIVNKPKLRKTKSELDKLCANITGMFYYENIINAPTKRQCRTNKKIDNVKTKEVSLKEKVTSNIEVSGLNEDKSKFIFKVGKPKNIKKKVQKSTIVLNKKKQFVKKSVANQTNNFGGKPVIQQCQVIYESKDNDDHNQQISVTDLNAQANDQKQPDSLFSIENKCYEQTIDEIEQNSIIDESTPESSIIHVNLPVSVNDKILPELNMLQFLPEQANQSPTKETRISTEQPEIQYSEYTFKEKSKTFVLAGLSCELINSMLLFKCSVSSCLEKFSTSVLIDFSKHIITNHQFVIWDGNCEACHHKSSIISDQYYVKDALEHLISHHLVLKNTEQHPNAKANLEGLSSFCQDSVSGDKLSVHKPRSSSISDICDISVSKSLSDDTNSIIKNGNKKKQFVKKSMANKTNNFDCKPVIQQCQVIYESKDNDDHNQQISVTDLNALANDQKQPDSLFSIENKCNEQTIDEIEQNSIIDESTPESSIIHVNLPVSVNDKILPELNMLQFLPEQANQSPTKETRISTEQPEIQYSEYTFKEKSKTFVLAGLSCELINSMLLFKCSVSSCLEKFSTSVLIDFSKHIITNHQFVIWDGNCEACHHKSSIISDQYYVKDALEHLISHHLVLKNTEQHPNAKANLEGLSSFCQASVSGDKLSVHKQRSSSISNICDMSVSISLGDDTNSINKNVNLNINHGSNDKKLTLSSLQISDVKSLKKRKVNTSKINSNASHNEDLNMWMKSKTISEVVVSNSETFLEEGQQIVNNGVPIDDTIFLIDTAYTKNYIRKLRDFPMSVMKTQLVFNKMSVLPRLMGLFKCMERYCTKIFCSKKLFKLHMAIHFSNAEKKKNQIYNVQQFKICAYCFKTFDDEESLADHIAEKYSFCEYFCPYCFYRAYTASHVFVHQSVVHTNISKPCIIQLQNDDAAFEYPREQLLVVDFKEFVLPYKCNIGCCGFSCYLHHEFLEHLNQKHKKCDKFCCYICANKDNGGGYFALCPSLLITHFKLHNLNKYQCIFCLFGSEIIDVMIKHLAFEHFEYDLLCLERSTVSDDCESKNIKNLKILRLKKVIDDGVVEMVNYLSAKPFSEPEAVSQQSKKRLIECPDDILSIAMKSARFDEGSQPPDAIVSTVPDSVEIADISTSAELTVHNNEFIIIDDDVNQNDTHVPLKITRVWSEFLNKEKNSEESSDDDIIVINDEDDVDLSEKENLNDCLKKQKESTNESNEGKRLVFPIELDKLFVCKKCEIVFSNGAMYCAHLKSRCPFWDKVAGQKCMYCDKVYKMAKSLIEHIKLHGPDRFNCSLCNLKVPTQRAITRHMKKHNIININFVPDCSNLTDFDKDYFTVFENKTVNTEKEEELPCNQCPFKGSVLEIMSHMIIYHTAEQNMDDGEQQPNDSNNSTNSLIRQQVEQQNTRLKIKRFTVDQVVGHQHNMLSTELNKNSKTILVNNKRKSYSPTRKNNIAHKKKVLVSQFIPDPVSNDDIIDLVDDSDTNN